MIDELPEGPDETPVTERDITVVRAFLDDLAVKSIWLRLRRKNGDDYPKQNLSKHDQLVENHSHPLGLKTHKSPIDPSERLPCS